MNKSILTIAMAAFLAVATSCHSAQKAVNTETRALQTEGSAGSQWSSSEYNPLTVAKAATEWTDFTASGNITVSTTSSLSSAIQLKMVRGKSVSISIRPLLGIEMGKLFIDADSVTIVDKYHSIYMRESVKQFLGSDMRIEALQNLLLSRPFSIVDGAINSVNAYNFTATAPDANGKWEMHPADSNSLFSYFFKMADNNVSQLKVTVNNGQSYSLNYSTFKPFSTKIIATEINASVAFSGVNAKLNIHYSKANWDNGVNDNIQIPSGAKRYSFAQVMKLLSK